MSILINGMEMPTDCCQCKLARYDDYENETFCPFTDVMCLSIGRQDDCPLEDLPSAQPVAKDINVPIKDCINRQAAIDAIRRIREVYVNNLPTLIDKASVQTELMMLPSAQPETAKRIVGKSRDGMTLWYQCDMCNEPVDAQDDFCRGCGRRLTDG